MKKIMKKTKLMIVKMKNKWVAHFSKMEVRVPQSSLEIGTAEKGLRFDRARWDKFQEAIVACERAT